MNKFWLVPAALVVLVVGPFLLWGEDLAGFLAPAAESGGYPGGARWMWLLAIGLLIADIFIPVPTTSIIAALGIVYGPVAGAGVAVVGTLLAAVAGYGLGRGLGRPIAARFVGESLPRGERLFARHGGWIVAASRWAPVLPEVISVVAGVSRMRFAAFVAAAFCGVVPLCAVFALVGHLGADRPVLTLVLSALAPLLLWRVAARLGFARETEAADRGD